MARVEFYKVVNAQKVQELIENGWQPLGSPMVITYKVTVNTSNAEFYQAMVMYEAEPVRITPPRPVPNPTPTR